MKTGIVEIKPLSLITVNVPIVGETELIMHAWDEKAKAMLRSTHAHKTRDKKPVREPEKEYLASMYRDEQGNIVFPAVGFKAAIVGACRLLDIMPMTLAKIAIRVNGQWVRIEGTPYMREDPVRLAGTKTDLRYRAGFKNWSATLNITYNAGVLTLEQLINLVNSAGFGGIGEWRPSAPQSATGCFGCFRVVHTDKESGQ